MSEIIQYKCPHCGGRVEFSSQSQKMKCPFCDSEFEIDEAIIEKEEKTEPVQKEEQKSDLKTYICQSCGGEIVTEENTSATSCPFCDNPIILSDNVKGNFAPEMIIPFKISKEEAKKLLLEHYKHKPYLPDNFKDENHLDEIKGIYVPYWIYNVAATISAHYECRKNSTHRRQAKNGYYEITDSAVYDVMRKGVLQFKNVPADASKKMDDKMMDSVEPFNFNEAKKFETSYLSGFAADKYDETSRDLEMRVKHRVEDSSYKPIENTIVGYNIKNKIDSNISFEELRAPYYTLCPVWLLNTDYNGTNYRFAVNGQTGKIVGKLPSDSKKKIKIFFKDFAISAAIALAAGLIIQLIGGLL